MDELIRTKTAPPAWMGDQIRRDALLARLDEALHRRLTLIHAPAGYGKTSLLAQWQQRHRDSNLRTAWLTLEKDDADLKRLTQYIALAIDGAGAGTGDGGARATPAPADLPPRAALSALINRLMREDRPVALLFDDFHRVDSPAVAEFMQSLIRLAPPHCHFIVASRDNPWLGQSALAAEEQLLEVAAEDLKFSASEAAALLGRNREIALDSEDMSRIFERTEGWPIALQLTALSLRRGADQKQIVERLGGTSSELARYLSEQVLMGLAPEVRDVVVGTALIEVLNGDIVNALCDRTDGWLLLEHLEQQGVFLTALSDERQAYRYHQLFAEYLRERLVRQDRERYGLLQRKAARWFADHGVVTQAVNHAILSGDSALLAAIVEEAGAWRLIPNGLQDVAANALENLPDALVRANPRLMLMRVYLAIKHGEMDEARAQQDWLVEAFRTADLSADLRTEIHMVGDVVVEYENQPVTFDDLLAREALLRTLPGSDHLMLGHFSESLGAKYYESGRLERALEPTLAAREHYQARGSLYSDVFTRFLEARIRFAQGRLKESIDILEATRGRIDGSFGERSDLAAHCAAFEAELLYEQDQVEEAAALLEWSLPHIEQSDGWVDVYAAAYGTAARIAAADGRIEDARATLARARRLAQRRRLRQLELLAQLQELKLLILHGQADGIAEGQAQDMGLDALAGDMATESPVYRQVAIAAALCRAQVRLIEGACEPALAELNILRQWASQHGAGRLLIEGNILLAYGLQRSGEAARARGFFDEAVGMAMFQGVVRPFIDARRFVEPMLRASSLRNDTVDRFRDQFLKRLSRAFSSRPQSSAAQGGLSAAEVEVLTYLCQGYANKEIARLIDMSPDTVKYRLKSLYKKLGVTKRRDAVAIARDQAGASIEAGKV